MKLTNVFSSPLSLFYVTLVCLPFIIVFTIFTVPTTTSNGGPVGVPRLVVPTTTAKKNSLDHVPKLKPTNKIQEMGESLNTTSAPPPPPWQPFPEPDSDEDKQIFQQASRVNQNPSRPAKLAFMFLTTTPLPFAPLWELFFNQAPSNLYNIYIHADPTFEYDSSFSGVFTNRVIPGPKPTHRHSPALISAERRLLSHALLHDPSNAMFALVSSSCIPLHSFNFTYRSLMESKKSFIEIIKNESEAYYRWVVRGEEALLPEVPFEKFRTGSQFFVLTRKHARLVVSDRRLWAKFKLPCLTRFHCHPEEHYFPTLISIKDPRGCIPATRTYVDWSITWHGHPRLFNASEVGPHLIWEIRNKRPRYGEDGTNGPDSLTGKRNDPFLFARKFSPDSIQPLMRIAPDVIVKD
ncbi:hypothetical protein NMG60_11028037 [Bertholletia excelsa]